jgi:hypothetical protein
MPPTPRRWSASCGCWSTGSTSRAGRRQRRARPSRPTGCPARRAATATARRTPSTGARSSSRRSCRPGWRVCRRGTRSSFSRHSSVSRAGAWTTRSSSSSTPTTRSSSVSGPRRSLGRGSRRASWARTGKPSRPSPPEPRSPRPSPRRTSSAARPAATRTRRRIRPTGMRSRSRLRRRRGSCARNPKASWSRRLRTWRRLGSAASYRVDGGQLELLSAEGTRLVHFAQG